jgi:pimeloyl-ACP methyl ester carboxylesterase
MNTSKFRIFILLAAFLFAPHVAALETGVTEVQRIETRDGVTVPIFTYWRPDAVASVVLFSGGAGGYGQIGEDGWPTGGNFLIRTGKHWSQFPFNLIMVGRPTDGIDLALGNVRTGQKHGADNVAIFKAIKGRSPLPIWVVGTSMGTISAAAATINDTGNLIAGLVLTSSIVAYKVPGAIPTQSLEKIRVPALIVHHENDACWACRPDEAKNFGRAITNAPIKKTILISGGSGATGNPCEPMHYHGYVGFQDETVDRIAAWILHPEE